MYTTKSGDTWDVIAKEVYGSEYHADVLMAANPQEIGHVYLQRRGGAEHPGAGGRAGRTDAAVEIRGEL